MSSLITNFDGGDLLNYYYRHPDFAYSASSGFDATDQGGNRSGRFASDSYYTRLSRGTRNTGFGRTSENWPVTNSTVHVDFWVRFNSSLFSPSFGASEFLQFRRRRLDVSSSIEGNEPHSKTIAFGIRAIPGNVTKGRFEAWLGNASSGGSAGLDTGNFCGSEDAFGIDPDTSSIFEVSLDVWYRCQVYISGTPDGDWEFWIDGKKLMEGSFSGLPWDRVSRRWESFGSFAIDVDDWHVMEGASGFLPETTITGLTPNESSTTSWNKVNVGSDPNKTHWSAIDDNASNFSLNDYVWNEGGGELELGFPRAFPQGQILSVQFLVLIRLDPAATYNGNIAGIELYLRRRGGAIAQTSAPFSVGRRSGSWWMTGDFWGQYHVLRWQLDTSPDGDWTEEEFVDRRWLLGIRHLGNPGKVLIPAVGMERIHLYSGGSGSRYRCL